MNIENTEQAAQIIKEAIAEGRGLILLMMLESLRRKKVEAGDTKGAETAEELVRIIMHALPEEDCEALKEGLDEVTGGKPTPSDAT